MEISLVEHLEGRIESLEASRDELYSENSSLRDRIYELETLLDKLELSFDKLVTQVDSLEDDVGDLDGRIDSLGKDVTKLEDVDDHQIEQVIVERIMNSYSLRQEIKRLLK